jgi:hypothetical protein
MHLVSLGFLRVNHWHDQCLLIGSATNQFKLKANQMKADKLIKLAREYVRCHEFEQKAKAARNAWMARWNKVISVGYFSSSEWSDKGVVLNISLAAYLEQYPDVTPSIQTSEWDGKRKQWMKYPSQYVGDIRTNFHLWVQSSTKSVEIPAATPAEAAA